MDMHAEPTSRPDDTNGTHTGKPELVSLVCENLCISLDASRCLDVHDTSLVRGPVWFLIHFLPSKIVGTDVHCIVHTSLLCMY
jgi:hypothetical protein